MLLVELISLVLTREMVLLLWWLLMWNRLRSLRVWQWQSYDRLGNALTFSFGNLVTLLVLVLSTERNSDSTVTVVLLGVRVDDGTQRGGLLRWSRSHHDRLLVQRCGIVLLFFALVRQRLQRRHRRVQNDSVLLVFVILDVKDLHLFLLLLLVGGQRDLGVVRRRIVALLDDDLDDRLWSFQVDRLVMVNRRWLVVVHRV